MAYALQGYAALLFTLEDSVKEVPVGWMLLLLI